MAQEENKSETRAEPGPPAADETGWDRVKALVQMRSSGDLSPEVKELSLTIFIASVAGFLFGGMIGARHAGDKFIAMNHASKFTSVMQAQRELHAASLLGFVRKGSAWGWRVGLFTGLFSGTSLVLSEYRDRQDTLNYVTAGAITGGLFRLARGLKPFIGGTVLGILVSVPVGVCMTGLDHLLVSEEEREEQRQRKALVRMKHRETWDQRLEATSTLIQDIADQTESLQGYYKHTESEDSKTEGRTSS